MATKVEGRQRELKTRDEIARETLGPNGEKLRAAIDERTKNALEAMEAARGDEGAMQEGLFDWFGWNKHKTGRFENIENIALYWKSGDSAAKRLLEYVPHPNAPFAFITSDGRRIVPGRFLTDGGTIPAFATVISGIDRFAYLPAYLGHDWDYTLKHCDRLDPNVTRQDSDRGLLEALKTMMTEGLVSQSRQDFLAIDTALMLFAESYWSADTECSLDPALV